MTSIGSSYVVPEWGVPTPGPADFGNEERRLLHESVLEALANFKKPNRVVVPSHALRRREECLPRAPPHELPCLQYDVIYCFDTPIPSVEQDKLGVTLPCVFHVAEFSNFGMSPQSSHHQARP